MSKAKPLTAEQCEAAREAMLTGHSLSKISRCAGVVATIEYMLKDIRLLETYLQRMASAITQKREQISHSALLLSMFHYEMSSLSLYDPAFKELDLHREEMPCQYRLLYDLFMNTGLRLKEVYLLEEDCIEESRYPNVCQLKYIPHKTLSARHRRGAGDYHRIMIPKDIAGRLSQHIIEDAEERKIAGTSYIFRSRRYGYERAVIDSQPFVKCIRGIIRKYDICDENGELWHFTIKQFRKTLAVRLIENGATTVELAYWLGHLCSDTAAKYYAEVRKKKLAELNTEFFRSKFELIMTGEQLENYTQEERRLLYTDFCLGQRRVELGFCVRKVADGPCADRCSLYNCVNCRNLCTGKQYLPYWKGLLQEQEKLLDRLAEVYKSESITDYSEYLEYKQEYRLLESYQSVVNMIEKEGCI